jgi:hypothetical protein
VLTIVGILDREVKTLDVRQNKIRHRRPPNAFSTTSVIVSPTHYVLLPSHDSGSNRDSLLGVGGDLYKYVA